MLCQIQVLTLSAILIYVGASVAARRSARRWSSCAAWERLLCVCVGAVLVLTHRLEKGALERTREIHGMLCLDPFHSMAPYLRQGPKAQM